MNALKVKFIVMMSDDDATSQVYFSILQTT